MRKSICVIGICVLLIFVFALEFKVGLSFPPNVNAMEEVYFENETELLNICEWLCGIRTDIRIDVFDSVDNIICYSATDNGGYCEDVFKITDVGLIDSLTAIQERKFVRILKEHDYIFFQKWGSFDESVGLIFSPNKEPDVSEINAKIKMIKKIKPEGWYYYKEKFE